MPLYRKKPVVIEAIQWDGSKESAQEINAFNGNQLWPITEDRCLKVPTLEGLMIASKGDYIIKGISGEFYPCKPDIFAATYEDLSNEPQDTQSTGLTFGQALERLRKGYRVARPGWNGKGMFVVYQKGYPQGIPCNKQTAEAWGMNEGDLFRCEPYLQIKMVNGSHAMWVPSINDVLAEDWIVVD